MMTPILKLASAWITSILVALSPASSDPHADAHETISARTARIESIGSDIAEIVYDPDEQPIFMGPNARQMTAAVVATFAAEEGMGFAHSVDSGSRRGDGGRSWCIMQMNVGKGKTPEGWTGPELIADRKKCIRAGLHALRRSYWYCSKNKETERFAVYASGSCELGRGISHRRYNRAMHNLYKRPAPVEIGTLLQQAQDER